MSENKSKPFQLNTDKNVNTHTLSEILTKLMKENQLDAIELSRLISLPVPTITHLKSHSNANPTFATLKPIAEYFGITIGQLLGVEYLDSTRQPGTFNPSARITKVVPIVAFEKLSNYLDLSGSKYETSKWPHIETSAKIGENAFALKICETLASPMFPVGSFLIFDTEATPKSYDYVVVKLGNKLTVAIKQLIIDGEDFYFKPFNQEVGGNIIHEKKYKIVATAIQYIRNYRS